ALHATGAPWARALWDAWSQQSDKFDPAKQAKSWTSFGSSGKAKLVRLGSLFHLALGCGWEPPAPPVDPSQPPEPAGPAASGGPVVHLHRLPDHILSHPNPRVRHHWQRLYRRANQRKMALARAGGLPWQH